MMGLLRLIAILAIAVMSISLLDSPMDTARRLAGKQSEQAGSRQAMGSLKIAVDLAGRREGRRIAILIDDWLYCYPETGEVFLVPRGYETDFASIPGAVRWLVSPFGNHAEAAVIHDWLYAVGEKEKRPEADAIFRFAMKENGVNIAKRNMMYQAVRTGGEKAYGAAREWRFRNYHTLGAGEPLFPRPSKAAVDTIDCKNLDRETPRIFEEYGGDWN